MGKDCRFAYFPDMASAQTSSTGLRGDTYSATWSRSKAYYKSTSTLHSIANANANLVCHLTAIGQKKYVPQGTRQMSTYLQPCTRPAYFSITKVFDRSKRIYIARRKILQQTHLDAQDPSPLCVFPISPFRTRITRSACQKRLYCMSPLVQVVKQPQQ